MPTPKLTINVTGHVIKNEAELDQVEMPVPEAIDHLDYTFEEMHTYSDINILSIEVSGGFTYSFRPGLDWTVDASYYDFDDRMGYVYGDESGSLFIIRSGVRLGF